MQPSPVGFAIFVVLLALVYALRGSVVSGLIASLAFATTAAVTLTSLGGSSPLIYVLFAGLFVGTMPLRRTFWRDFGSVSAQIRIAWIVYGLLAYAVVGSLLFPRLFAGQVGVFVASRERNGVFEVPLMPVSGNTTQTGYFVMGGLIFIAVCVLLTRRRHLEDIYRGFLILTCVHTLGGLIDLAAKLAGIGDVLAPIRTASYEMITNAEQAGFARIVGLCSEASTFGGISLACIAFTYTYWRKTKSRLALILTATLAVLILLSTSTTAYAGMAILCFPVGFSLLRTFLASRIGREDILLVASFLFFTVAFLALIIYSQQVFDSINHLIDKAIINKADSESGRERAYWNYKSLQAFVETFGLGVGMGSSRASSWPIAVISQLGFVGALMLGSLLGVLFNGLGRLRARVDARTRAIVASVRAASLAGLLSASISGGSADPGIIFFVALAVVSTVRAQASRSLPVEHGPASLAAGYAPARPAVQSIA